VTLRWTEAFNDAMNRTPPGQSTDRTNLAREMMFKRSSQTDLMSSDGSERRFYISTPSATRQILLRDGPVIIWNWLQRMSGIDKFSMKHHRIEVFEERWRQNWWRGFILCHINVTVSLQA